jgi:hypothetical protein
MRTYFFAAFFLAAGFFAAFFAGFFAAFFVAFAIVVNSRVVISTELVGSPRTRAK